MKRNRKITTITGGIRPWYFLGCAINLFDTTYIYLDDAEIEQLEALMVPTHGLDMSKVETLARANRRWL